MAGQIANVPEVANYLYTFGAFGAKQTEPYRDASISRNDLVRDTIGAITTRSNVYSIWVVAQTAKKKSSNSDYGAYERGDSITSTIRRRYLVERYIEPGKDLVAGNTLAPYVANTPNAFSYGNTASNVRWNGDPVDPNFHPPLPYPLPYRWRVISVQTYTF